MAIAGALLGLGLLGILLNLIFDAIGGPTVDLGLVVGVVLLIGMALVIGLAPVLSRRATTEEAMEGPEARQ
jgi:hypothetical protein